jgi:hypothetical protein
VPARSGAPRSRAPGPTREVELYAPVKAFLEARGYDVKGEIAGCDLVAVRDEEPPIIVELKLAFTLGLVLQGVDRLGIADTVYLAVPAGAARRRGIRPLCRRLGLGLLAVHAPRPASRSLWIRCPIVRGATTVVRRACSGSTAGGAATRRPAGAPGRRL